MAELKVKPNSPEHAQARVNRITASVMDIVVNGSPLAWLSLMRKMREEQLAELGSKSGVPALDWGNHNEANAAALYEFRTGAELDKVAIVIHDTYDYIASSPDRVERHADGTIRRPVEIKCPFNSMIHERTRVTKQVPEEYLMQCHTHIACADTDEARFMSYDPRAPEAHQSVIIPVYRDEKILAKIYEKCAQFMELYLSGEEPQRQELTSSMLDQLKL